MATPGARSLGRTSGRSSPRRAGRRPSLWHPRSPGSGADRLKNKQSLTGTLAAGATVTVPVQPPVQLGNKGGIITLLDDRELKVDGVSYTEQQAQREGWTLVF